MYSSYSYIGGGRFSLNSGQDLRRRSVRHYRLLYLEQGKGVFYFQKDSVSVQAGNTYLLAPGPREAHYDKLQPVVYEYIEFDCPEISISHPCINCSLDDPFNSALIYLIKCTIREASALRTQLIALAIGLALHDISMHKADDPRLRKALVFVDDNQEKNITVSQLASVAGLSEAHLRRIFRKELNVSPKQYLLQTRMNYARTLMQAENLRVQEVANILEFPSAFQFSAQYRRVHGVPPSTDLGKSDKLRV